MTINLNNPEEFTKENLILLMSSVDDTKNTQYRITKDGILFLSEKVGNLELSNIAFRLESNMAGNGYAGPKAANNEIWVSRIFEVIKKNWPNPKDTYCDLF